MTSSKARWLWPMIALAAVLCAAPAPAMTAEEFLTRAQALKARGMMAIFQKKEINALLDEIKLASEAYAVDRKKALPGVDPALGCPPPANSKAAKEPKNRMTSDQFLTRLAAIPREERQRASMKAAYYEIIRTRFPCPATWPPDK